MADLVGTTVAANYRKTAPSTQFGTRALRFIKVTIDNSGSNDKDLTTANNGGGSYTDSNSYYSAAVNALQGYCELYAVLTPSATAFVAVVSDDTAQDSDTSTNAPGGWGDAEANILSAIQGVDSSTKYDGGVAITTGTWAGGSVSFA